MTLSPGLLNSCFELLGVLSRQTLTARTLSESFSIIGVMPTEEVKQCAFGLRWVTVDADGVLMLTVGGEELNASEGHCAKLRRAILDFIDIEDPVWIQNAQHGRSQVLAYLDVRMKQVFVEAGLLDSGDGEVIRFWDSLGARARGLKNDRLLAIGRRGEALTVDYETKRTKRRPRWIALDSNADGYDILSIVSANEEEFLSIEVKTTTAGLRAGFHVSRNEWERASLSRNHAFYLWDIGRKLTRLAIVEPEKLEPHIAANRGDGEWESVEIPFESFLTDFVEYFAD
jgi:hypothetical protein